MKQEIQDFYSQAALDPTEVHKILLVEDELFQLSTMQNLIVSWGYACLTAENGWEAIGQLDSEEIELVITDIIMPGMDGIELLNAIQHDFPKVDVIVLTGQYEKHSFAEILKLGAIDYLEKPVDMDELKAKLDRFFREKFLDQKLRNELTTQQVLTELFKLSIKIFSFDVLLRKSLEQLTSFPWLELEPKGAILLVDEEQKDSLALKAALNLTPDLHNLCARVSFGHCLCGRAAMTGEVIFASHIDERHDTIFPGMHPHGHYCVPIKTASGEILGVFTLYVKEGSKRKKHVEETLLTAASTMALIIQHHQTEAALADQQNRSRAITDNALDAIVMMDDHGAISFLNPAAERMFGYSYPEVAGQDLHGLLAPKRYFTASNAGLMGFSKTGQGSAVGTTIEVTALRKGGEEFPIELSISGLKFKDKWYAVGIIRDISDRKRSEEENKKLNKQLMQAHKMEAIGTLAGGIAHDFNNILGAILGFAEIAQDEVPVESQIHADLNHILVAGRRAKDLVHQILTFSRQMEQERFPLKVHLIIKETIKLLRASIPANIEIIQDIEQNCGSVMADPSQLQQVVMNLCTNAYYAMRERGGKLTLGLHEIAGAEPTPQPGTTPTEGTYLELTVADTGTGIPATVLEHIFEPFYTTKPQGEGTGMGLSLVHGIVVDLGGTISVSSTPGQGTVFTVRLPSVVDWGNGDQKASPLLLGGGQHILLVDDEMELVELGSRNLIKLGYKVSARTSSVEAFEAFTAQPDKYDLIITDQAMPNMTGLEMAIKILELRKDAAIVLVSGFTDKATLDYAKNIGIKEIVNKPVSWPRLSEIIQSILEG